MDLGESPSGDVKTILEIPLRSWAELQGYVQDSNYSSPDYIWRGQANAEWQLTSGLDRALEGAPEVKAAKATRHLERFKQAARGRRGENPNQPTSDDDWWALAQHNAMLTPLLDWTESTFVALYFAFEKQFTDDHGSRAVWALSTLVEARNQDENRQTTKRSSGKLDIVRPQQDENSRLRNQAGLFTKVPSGTTVEQWVLNYGSIGPKDIAITKFTIPDEGREDCLRLLNRMNINHLSLFPDLYGAGKHCNNVLLIEDY